MTTRLRPLIERLTGDHVNNLYSKVSHRRRSSFFRLAGCVAIRRRIRGATYRELSRIGDEVPPPAHDETSAAAHSETAVFAGGCFWGVQGVFEHVRGVKQVASGYTGGAAGTAQYETVSEGDTGHAESVQVTYDPTQITYGRLLQIFFSVAHNPTELDYQGPDHGTQYRSGDISGQP